MIADVMLNQLDMNTYATSNHKICIAAPDLDNKSEQQVGTPEYKALIAEVRQLKNHMASVTEGTGGNNKHNHNRDHERKECQAYTAYIAGIKHDNCYSDDGYIDGDIPDTGGGVVSNEPLINTGLD